MMDENIKLIYLVLLDKDGLWKGQAKMQFLLAFSGLDGKINIV